MNYGKKTGKRRIVGMVSEASGQRTYYTTKNPQNVTEKLSLRKYDPVVRKACSIR